MTHVHMLHIFDANKRILPIVPQLKGGVVAPSSFCIRCWKREGESRHDENIPAAVKSFKLWGTQNQENSSQRLKSWVSISEPVATRLSFFVPLARICDNPTLAIFIYAKTGFFPDFDPLSPKRNSSGREP